MASVSIITGLINVADPAEQRATPSPIRSPRVEILNVLRLISVVVSTAPTIISKAATICSAVTDSPSKTTPRITENITLARLIATVGLAPMMRVLLKNRYLAMIRCTRPAATSKVYCCQENDRKSFHSPEKVTRSMKMGVPTSKETASGVKDSSDWYVDRLMSTWLNAKVAAVSMAKRGPGCSSIILCQLTALFMIRLSPTRSSSPVNPHPFTAEICTVFSSADTPCSEK